MKKRTRFIAGILALGLSTAALAGCGKTEEKAKNTAATEPKKLTVWSHWLDAEGKNVKFVVDQWAKEKGVQVTFAEDKSKFEDYPKAANSPQGPDVVIGIPHDNLGKYQLTGTVAEAPAGVVDANALANPGYVDAVSVNGKVYGMPLAAETYALFYNKDRVADADVPKTYADLIAKGKTLGFQYDITNFYFTYHLIAGNGGYVFKNNAGALDPNDIGLGNDGAKKGYQMIQDLVVKEKLMAKDIKGDVANGNFKANKIAFYISGPWDIQGMKDAKVNFGVAALPSIDGTNPTPSFMGVQTGIVNAKTKSPVLAWDLLSYISKNYDVFKGGNRIPVTKTGVESVSKDPIIAGFAAQLANAQPMPNIPAMGAVWQPAADTLSLLVNQKATVDQAATDIVKKIKEGIALLQ